METKLTDFTYSELQFLSLAMQELVMDCNTKLGIISEFDDCETKRDLTEHWTEHRKKAALWAVQAFNASVEVKKAELIADN